MILRNINKDGDTVQTLRCNCGWHRHELTFTSYNDDMGDVFITIHLNFLPFWKRVKYAFKYIFNRVGENDHAYEDIFTTEAELKEIVENL